jgi:hypothetical protein
MPPPSFSEYDGEYEKALVTAASPVTDCQTVALAVPLSKPSAGIWPSRPSCRRVAVVGLGVAAQERLPVIRLKRPNGEEALVGIEDALLERRRPQGQPVAPLGLVAGDEGGVDERLQLGALERRHASRDALQSRKALLA